MLLSFRILSASGLILGLVTGAAAESRTFSVAEALISPSNRSRLADAHFVSSNRQFEVINFQNASDPSPLHFAGAVPAPQPATAAHQQVAMHITALVDVPSAGSWSFGVFGNQSFHLATNSQSFSGRGARMVPLTFSQAGDYALDLTTLGSAASPRLELFATEGRFRHFASNGASWRLVGDSADGGLALDSFSNDSNAPSVGNAITTSQSPLTVTAEIPTVPEPGLLLGAALAALLLAHRPIRSSPR